ncbi:hypothetical protein DV735_g3041, partial [Chaetothyriales sp. CBS 134920]
MPSQLAQSAGDSSSPITLPTTIPMQNGQTLAQETTRANSSIPLPSESLPQYLASHLSGNQPSSFAPQPVPYAGSPIIPQKRAATVPNEDANKRARLPAATAPRDSSLSGPANNNANYSQRFHDALELTRLEMPSQQLSMTESQRIALVSRACKESDTFFLLLHQLYCLYSLYPPAVTRLGFGQAEKAGLATVDLILGQNSLITHPVMNCFANFPYPFDELEKREYAPVVDLVKNYLVSLGLKWEGLQHLCLSRRFPPCWPELIYRFSIPSIPTMATLFICLDRRINPYRDIRWESQVLNLFSRSRDRFQSARQQVGFRLEQYLSPAILAFGAEYQNMLSNLAQLLPPLDPRRNKDVSLHRKPSPQPRPSPRPAPWPPAKLFRVDSSRVDSSRVDNTRVDSSRVDSTRVDSSRVDNTRVDNTRVDSSRVDSSRVDNTRVDNTRVDNTRVDNTRVDSIRVDSIRVGSIRVDSIRVDSIKVDSIRVDSIRVGSIRVGSIRVDSIRVDSIRVGSIRVDSIRVGSREHSSRVGRNGHLPPSYVALLPPEGFQMAQASRPNPDKLALHQLHLRSPTMAVLADPADGTTTKPLYAYVTDYALSPQRVSWQDNFCHWKFDLSAQLLARRPGWQPSLVDSGGPTARQYTAGCVLFRLKCVKQAAGAPAPEAGAYAEMATAWPAFILISFNQAGDVDVRRKTHWGRDLATDITDLVRPGRNTLSLSYHAQQTEQSENFYVAVQVLQVSDQDSVRDLVKTLDEPTALAAITAPLQKSLEDDDILCDDASLSIDLVDPFMAKIWTSPVRGRRCLHRECFDLDAFLISRASYMEKNHHRLKDPDRWTCPICGRDARPQELVMDGFLVKVRAKLEADGDLETRSIRVFRNGSWIPGSDTKREASTAPDASATADPIEISDDDE